MYRVVVPACLVLLLPACSMNSSSLSAGIAENPAKTAASKRRTVAALGGEPAADRSGSPSAPRLAGLDHAPKGSYETAPSGALADRDYSQTRLDAERARELVNAYRKERGLKPLKLNVELSNAAKAHSKDLAKWDRISHYGSDGSNPWDRVKRSGYNAKLAAENVGTGQTNIDEVFKGWKESPGHNKNLLLADAEHMGIALVQEPKSEFKTFWTLVLGTPM